MNKIVSHALAAVKRIIISLLRQHNYITQTENKKKLLKP
jgi:hypothetical protein